MAPLGGFGNFGPEAVAIFFVISGYVIAFTTHGKSTSCQDYVVARCARIMPVAVIALAFTFVVDSCGRSVAPELYAAAPFYHPNDPLFSLLASLTFTSELWGNHIGFGSDEPYWSLVYEVWYYAAWGVLIYARGLWRLALVISIGLIAGPHMIAFFPIWLIGAGCYYLQQKPAFRSVPYGSYTKIAIAALLIVLSIGLKYLCFDWITQMMRFEDPHRIVQFLSYFYLIGILLGAGILLLTPPGKEAAKPGAFAHLNPVFAWLAGVSFTLYLVHEPALLFAKAIVPRLTENPFLSVLALASVILVAAAIAQISERPRRRYRQAIIAMIAAAKGLAPTAEARPAAD